jgi:hypothetical protein
MAHLPIIIGCNRVALEIRSDDGQSAVNVIHVSSTDTADNVVSELDAAMHGAPAPDMWAGMADTAAVYGFELTPLDGTSASIHHTFADPIPGQGDGQYMPAVAQVVTHRTATRGRSARGRNYIPFIAESGFTDGHFGGDLDVVVAAGWNSFRLSLAALAIPITFVVASYKHSEAHAITHTDQQHFAGTQRRRQSRLRS